MDNSRVEADQTHAAYQAWSHAKTLVVQAARALLSGGDALELQAALAAEESARAQFAQVAS